MAEMLYFAYGVQLALEPDAGPAARVPVFTLWCTWKVTSYVFR